ncbi:MAG: hypothetical protein C0601_03155 [Candidatus Muiribacterium halophilum]|uniref:PPM-type phosphatase domain-containing protein n=1 Tax=Muiribacterium halophilum TaxID=2053465 RepID=A0A2N5ZK91_MUIH1|nr:MAG: hypothetical protein C0601_03155 [Candidatus Muirbacterium halophilum]
MQKNILSNKDSLKFLQEISYSVSTVFNFDALIRIVVDKIMEIMNCERCSIVLLDEDNKPFVRLAKGFKKDGFTENEKISQIGDVTSTIINTKKSILDNERKFLSVPIINNDRIIGIINITDRKDLKEFTEAEENLLFILSTQIGYAIETIRLHKNIIKMERLTKEMELAASLQSKIVKEISSFDKVQMCTYYKPAFEVGGDYFEKFKITDDLFLVALGDVSGKGLYASIIVVMLHSLLKMICNFHGESIDLVETARTLNNTLYEEIGNDLTYSTMVLFLIDTKNNKMEYVNAGHNYPLFLREKNIDTLKTGGIFLGSFNGLEYKKETIDLKKDDLLCIYSDGLIEYESDIDNLQRQDDFKKILKKHSNLPLEKILDKIFYEYYDFQKKQLMDDVSIILMRF